MDEKIKKNKFLNSLTAAGAWIAQFFMMQLLWVFYTLKGGIVLGAFPAFASIVQVFCRWFEEKDQHLAVGEVFKKTYKGYFKKANQVGYIFLLAFAVLYVDLRVSNVFIQSIFLHTVLLFFAFLVLCVAMYSSTVMIKYDFGLKNILKQSFFVSLAVPVYTLSAGVGLLIVFELLRNYTFLLFFFGIPLLILPVAWFTYTGTEKAEEKKREDSQS